MLVPTIAGIPVLLPPHSHKDFGQSGIHYHVDFRFIPDTPVQSRVIFTEEDPVYIELTQERESYSCNIQNCDLLKYLSDRHSCVTSCGRCPHKGLPLMQLTNEVFQCPGHGLCFDSKGEVLKDYFLCIGSCCLPVKFKQKEYVFNIKEEIATDLVEIRTPTGVKIGHYLFPKVFKLVQGDLFRLTLK